MKSAHIFFLLGVFIIIIYGCSRKEQLSKPKIFKELKLGMDFDSVFTTVNDEICMKNLDPENFIRYQTTRNTWPITMEYRDEGFCQYLLTSNIYASPNFFSAKYNDKKILGSATLTFHSPSSFPFIEVLGYDELLKRYNNCPALTNYEVEKIVEMYDAQYGARVENTNSSQYAWLSGDLSIRMYKEEYNKYWFVSDSVLTTGAYRVVVTYNYIPEKLKLLELGKETKSGEKVGNKI